MMTPHLGVSLRAHERKIRTRRNEKGFSFQGLRVGCLCQSPGRTSEHCPPGMRQPVVDRVNYEGERWKWEVSGGKVGGGKREVEREITAGCQSAWRHHVGKGPRVLPLCA